MNWESGYKPPKDPMPVWEMIAVTVLFFVVAMVMGGHW